MNCPNDGKGSEQDVLELALRKRHQGSVQRVIKQAGFPTVRTLDGYDFSPITFPESLYKASMVSLD